MRKSFELLTLCFLVTGLIILGLIAIVLKNLSNRKRERELQARYYKASNPNWRKREKPQRRIYREHEELHSHRKRKPVNVEEVEMQSAFWSVRLLLLMALVIGFPFVIFAFAESIRGFTIILLAYIVVDAISKRQGWDKMDYYD